MIKRTRPALHLPLRCVGAVMLLLLTALASAKTPVPDEPVRLYEETILIPTYPMEPPDPNPIFFNGRGYQGAQGRVYPYPFINRLSDEKVNKPYRAVFLENQYVKVCVLPELGGRLHYALDKTNGYYFIYHNRVIKPALIGMLGAWLSGGVEWNIPHHHRATTVMPVDYRLVAHADGSKTVWVGELERRDRLRWAVGLTLQPASSCVSADIRVFNPTPVTQSFLVWANAAVHANEQYQVLFPPRTEHVTYHQKNVFSAWPVSHQQYAGADYSAGVDLSYWKNHAKSNSFFAWDSEGQFVGGYDHGRRAGTAIVANPHVAPGKKFWNWGNSPFARMWYDMLTDADGPYIELMAGAFSDNQPDYSWIAPNGMKRAEMTFLPLRDVGVAQEVNRNGALGITADSTGLRLVVYATRPHRAARVRLRVGETVVYDQPADIDPAHPFSYRVPRPRPNTDQPLTLTVETATGEPLLQYESRPRQQKPMPDPVEAPRPPSELRTVEEVLARGLRFEQFHHPSVDPLTYYREALRREPDNAAVNTQVGINYLKRGRFAEAETHLRRAVARATQHYTTPKDADALYYLGLALVKQRQDAEAYLYLYRATWDAEWQSAAYYQLACLDGRGGAFGRALEHVEQSLFADAHNLEALSLKTALLRQRGERAPAEAVARQILLDDPLHLRATYELARLTPAGTRGADPVSAWLASVKTDQGEQLLETALAYADAGLYADAHQLLRRASTEGPASLRTSPLLYYHLAHLSDQLGNGAQARQDRQRARQQPIDYCFPYRFETAEVLQQTLLQDPTDARANLYLGNLYYDHQPDRAIGYWETAVRLDSSVAVTHRNLAFAYANHRGAVPEALTSMRRAIALRPTDPLYYYEYDQYADAANVPPAERLAFLEANHPVVVRYDNSLIREINLQIRQGKYDAALTTLRTHHFRQWEGGGNIHNAWVDALLLRGHGHLKARRFRQALADFEQALTFPRNLEIADNNRFAQIYYFMGLLHEQTGEGRAAAEAFRKATTINRYFLKSKATNEKFSELHFYQALAYRKLGDTTQANQLLKGLLDHGSSLVNEPLKIDFFNPFTGRESERDKRANAYYLMGLAYLGTNQLTKAQAAFAETTRLDPAYFGLTLHL